MSRFLTSIGILLALTVLSVTSLFLLRNECSRYMHLTDQTAAAFERGDTQAALAEFDRLESDWQHFHDVAGVFVDGSKLDAIYSHIIVLRPMLEEGYPEASAELDCIRLLTRGLYEEELPLFWHIL